METVMKVAGGMIVLAIFVTVALPMLLSFLKWVVVVAGVLFVAVFCLRFIGRGRGGARHYHYHYWR